ncbi:MAG: lipopolysaccharide biosynthesis protein [Halodesulfovibrio sp.]|uniref:lipopolysaccharide biosynthesis protein n=1 Tax=Halodesulfovibrio sp. TaxID=1912772 RepID=UPI00359EBD29
MYSRVLATIKKFLFGNLLSNMILLLMSVIFSRKYGVHGRGVYALIVTIPAIITVLFSFGLNNSIIYHLKKKQISVTTALHYLFFLTFWLVSLVWLLRLLAKISGAAFVLNDFLALGSITHPFLWTSVILLTMAAPLKLFLISYFQSIRDIKMLLIAITVLPFCQLLLLSFWPGSDQPGFLLYMLCYAGVECTLILCLTIYLYYVSVGTMHQKTASLFDVVSYSLKGYIGSINGTINSGIDVLLIEKFAGTSELGLYSNAKSIVRMFQVLSNSVANALLGYYLELDRTSLKIFHKKVSLSLAVGYFILFTVAYLLSEYIVYYLYGAPFLESLNYLPYLLFAAYLVTSSTPDSYVFSSCNKPHITSIIASAGFIVAFGVGIIAGKSYGVIGILIALCSSSVVTYSLRKFFVSKLFRGRCD